MSQASGPRRTDETEARSCARRARTLSSDRLPSGLSGSPWLIRRSAGDQGRDDDAAVRLVAFAVGLDARAVFEVLVHDAALLCAHRVKFDRPLAADRLLRGTVGPGLQRLAPALAVAGDIDDHPLAL